MNTIGDLDEAHMLAGAIMQALADSGLVLALADVRRETDRRTFRALVRFSKHRDGDAL